MGFPSNYFGWLKQSNYYENATRLFFSEETESPPPGFDHNFVISDVNNATNQFEVNHFVARFEHEKSGRFLEVSTETFICHN